MKQTSALSDLQAVRRHNALLEKQLNKVKVELSQSISAGSGGSSGKNRNKKKSGGDDVNSEAAAGGADLAGVNIEELQLR